MTREHLHGGWSDGLRCWGRMVDMDDGCCVWMLLSRLIASHDNPIAGQMAQTDGTKGGREWVRLAAPFLFRCVGRLADFEDFAFAAEHVLAAFSLV